MNDDGATELRAGETAFSYELKESTGRVLVTGEGDLCQLAQEGKDLMTEREELSY